MATAVSTSPAPPESGLDRRLGVAQQMLLAVGGAIGTGLFLGSGLSVGVAGPAVLVSYVLVALLSRALVRALTDLVLPRPRVPWASVAGAIMLAAVTLTTAWIPGLRVTILAGPPWLALAALGYWLTRRRTRLPADGAGGHHSDRA